jgi:PKD repeat protein
VTYIITPSIGGCAGTSFNLVVTVNPTSVITSVAAQTVCNTTPLGYTATSSTVGASFSWTRAVVAGISNGIGAGATAFINESLTNTTTAPVNAIYIITPGINGCNGTPFTLTVTVNPTAVITSAATANVCDNVPLGYTAISSTAGATFAWTRAVVAGIANGIGAGATALINESLDNTVTAPVAVTYIITPSIGGCAGTSFNLVVTVNPTSVITSVAAQTVCNTTPLGYTATSSTVGASFSWTRAVVAGISNGIGAGATALINESLTNTTTAPVNAIYIITPGINGCNGTPFSLTVTVNPAGQVDQPVNQSVCNGANTAVVNFTTTNIGGVTTYSWTNSVPGIGLPALGNGNIGVFAAVNGGTAPVVATIVVTPLFTNNAVSCTGPAKTFTITVNPTPILTTTLTPVDVCSNTLFSYPPASATAGTTFNWTRAAVAGITPAGPTAGVNNPNETLRNITSAPVAVTYQYTLAANGCSNVQNVVVNINPEPVITPAQNPSACSGNALSYAILLNNFTNPADNVTFTWGMPVLNPVSPLFTGGSARAVSSAANITDTYTNTTGVLGTATYTVTPFKNGCSGAPVTVVITVGSQPVLDPGLNAFACSNTPIGLILNVAGGSVIPTYYNIISKTVAPGLIDVGNAIVPNGTAPAAYLSTDKFTNTTGVDKTVTYRVQPILAPTCIGAAVDVVITIRPQPVIFPAQTKTVCSSVTIGKEIILAPPNVPAGSLFNWPVPVISDASVQGTAGVNVVADPTGTLHINDQIHNYSAAPIFATYTVTPVSQFGCAGTAVPVIITVNPEPVPQPISGRDKICVTDKNIVYNVSAVGGSTFHWTVDAAVGTKTFDFNTNAILIDAAAVAGSGNITVFETNSYTCSGDVSTLPVQVYAQPAPENIIGNAVVCANSSNVYSVTNRVGSVYSWTVPGGAAIIGDPSANSITIVFANVGGTISVRETNAAGCITNHTPKAVTVNPLPTAIISGGGTICDGASRNLTVTFTGTGPYAFTYALDGVPQLPVATAANPYILNVTAAGTYTIVNVSDANCTNNGTGTTPVSYFPKPTGTISGTAEMCKGGSATLTMTFTGTAPYTFTYTDGVTPVNVVGYLTNVYTVSVSPLINTTYTLTSLTDGNSCAGVVSGSAVITINVPPVPTLTGTNLICNGINTGAVSMAIAGGTAPFGFSWTGPDGFTANTQNISALEAGYYAVVVTDSKGCTGNANITLTQPPVLNGSVAGTNITCFGANDGTITVSGATGGAGTYEFTINGGGAWQASPNFAGLAPGTFNVMMRDAANPTCIHVLNNALILTGPAVLNATVVKTDVNCFGANNGSIVISAPTGGYGTYGYSIDGGATWQGSGNFTNLAPVIYDVRIRDAVNTACVKILNPALTITQPLVLSATVNSTNITCFGLTNGTITISAPLGGHGTFEYSINGGGSWQASGNFINLTPGTYNVQIRDAAYTGCFIVLNAGLVISQPPALAGNVASTNVTCNGANDGIISITAPLGGYGTYEYSINGGTTWQAAGLFNGLAPVTYDVRIRDAANPLCFIILNAGLQITQPAVLSATLVSTDVTCFGANDGVIQITNSAGGYGTYEYSDNGGTTWQATGLFTLLTPATYNVVMRDKAHTSCVLILNAALAITQPAILNATVNHTNVTCFGANDGTITISAPTGGYGSYGYSVNGGTSWQGSGNFTNLAPGTYNIRIRDAVNTGCIIPLNPAVVITEPAVLSGSIVSTAVTCNGANNGTITINGAAGGYGTYEYTINGGTTWQASPVFSALIPGFYNVKIRDAVNIGCIVTLNGSLNITEPPALNANVAKTNVTCNGANNGTITISSPTGGYGTYEYSINGGTGWQASPVFSSLIPGSYNVQIRDAAHTACVITLNPALIVTEPVVLSATVTPTMVTCNGANNGIIAITGAAGGYGTYEYSVNGGTTWSGLGNFTNLAPNTYNVQIRDAAQPACVVTLNPALIITQPPVLSATVAKSNITCFGASDGTITVSVPAGGYGTYEYSINGGGSWQASGNFTLLGPGNYNVQIRDAAHPSCVIVLNNAVQITQPAILNAVVTATNVTCKGANDGIINITAPTGGSGTYGYSIDGGTTWHAAGLFNGLVPATYNVQIRDAVNTACVITLNAALIITEPNILSATVTSSNVTCNGANDGTISITNPVGGYGTYEYSINGGTGWQASPVFSSLIPGSYNVQIRDKAHTACVIILNPALIITQPPLLSATVASSNVTCFGANNGTITITNPLGGYGTYEYSINGGAGWQGSGSFGSLPPATYDVQIRDAAHPSCLVTLNAALVITQPPVLSATVNHTNVTCSGANDGTITISAPAGGYGTYEYSVNGGTSWQASGNFAGLIPGFYNVQIRDAAHTACVVILNGSLQLTQPAALNAIVNSTSVTCNGANDGTITISSPTGGYGTYEYSINGGAAWQASGSFTGLAPATYTVVIRDAAHTACVITLNAALVITQPAVMTATVTPLMVTCNGANDGKITISGAAGGYGTYQFSINGGTTWQGSGTFTNLAPASYNVQIRDAANTACVIILNPALLITQPPVLSATLAKTNVTCFGGNDGTITISAPSGGYGTYEYSVNGGGSWQASGNFTLLTPGAYNVLIRDAANTGCIVVLNNSYTISQPAQLAATVTKTDVTCKGANDGTITISSPSGGSGTYQYSVDGGGSWVASGNFVNLVPATYDVRIRDAANTACSAILYPNMVITEPILLALTSTGDILLDCFGDVDGSGTFYASGGTLPYNFHVVANTTGATLAAPGFNSQTFFNAGTGTITIAVTDFKGCFAQATINVTQPVLLTPGTIAANQVLCSGDNPAQLTETVPAAGGPGAYNYQWQYGSTAVGPFINIAGANGTLYTPPAGATTTLYYRRMITSGICLPAYSNVVEVLVNPKPVAILTGGETICPAQTSILNVNMMVGTGPFEVNINNFGTVTGYVSGANIVVSPAVTTTYTLLSVKDANGCEVLSPSANLLGSATVTVRALPAITTSPVNKTTCEFGMVTFNVVATGTDLTYQWYVNTGSGFNPVADGGVYFGATNSTLSIFGATRLMNGYIYHVVVTGCSSSVTSTDATLTVNTDPEITAQPKDTTACMNAGADFSVSATGTGVTYQWQVNKGAGFINVVDDANFSGSALNTLTIINAQAAFNNYIFRVILTGTCGIPVYSNFAVLRVSIPPVITLNPVNKSACDGTGPLVFTGNGSGIIDSLRWQVFSGGVWSDIIDNAVYSGTASQQLTLVTVPLALNGNQYRLALKAKCTTVYTTGATLTVNPNPVVNFSAVDPIHACGNVPLVINGNPTGGSGIWATHLWTGDIGPLNNYFIQSPTFNSQIAGTYALNYKVKDSKGCTANGDVTVLVDAPDASFSQDKSTGCTPATVTFTKDMTGIAKFWWDFGDGSPKDSVNANPVHTFTNTNVSSIEYYNVKLTVRSPGGCLDSFTSLVTVYPAIDASFTATPSTICSGGTVIFTALPGASRYFWDFGDGVSGYFPNTTNHIYTNFTTSAENDTITLTTTSFYNCVDVKKMVVKVMPVPVPQFTALPVSQIYNAAGNPVVFTNTTNAGTWTWLWKFGDGATATDQSPTHTYTGIGTFDVVLVAGNANCSDSVVHSVTVTPIPPVANFDLIPSGCSPLNIEINNTSLNTNTPGTTYMWDFGDGGASTAKNPTYTYFDPGTFRVQLTVTGPGGTSTYSQVVNSYPSPKANFQVSPTVVFVNDEAVRMFNLTQGADSYLWEFGDGDTSKVKEPYHKYMAEGVYDITLWAYLHNVVNGQTITCSDKYVLSPAVTVEPTGVLRFSTVFTPNTTAEIEMDHLPTSGVEVDQFFFPPVNQKVLKYKLQVFNRLGVLIFESNDINIPWNGYYHHKLCPQGVYVWYVQGKYANGQPFKKVGDVTLLH